MARPAAYDNFVAELVWGADVDVALMLPAAGPEPGAGEVLTPESERQRQDSKEEEQVQQHMDTTKRHGKDMDVGMKEEAEKEPEVEEQQQQEEDEHQEEEELLQDEEDEDGRETTGKSASPTA
jgi:hypothetical protein